MHTKTDKHNNFTTEKAAYCPQLEQQLRDCLQKLEENDSFFEQALEPELIEESIYLREALLCRYAYLLRQARRVGLRGAL